MLYLLREQQNKYSYPKSENFENISFLPITYKNVTKNPKTLSESEKNVSREEKDNSNTLTKVNAIKNTKDLLVFCENGFCCLFKVTLMQI